MIISTLRKFIFTAIPKTGTHSIRRALREHMGNQDLEQVGLFIRRQLPFPELARLGHGHLTLDQIRPYLSPDDWNSFFKFAFVRNPFDRFVSYCSFITRETGLFARGPKAVMRRVLAHPPHGHILFQPQCTFVMDVEGGLLTDYIGRVERMQESYDEIAARIGIPTACLQTVNATKRLDYHDYYDQPLIDGVAKLYERDLQLFGYEF